MAADAGRLVGRIREGLLAGKDGLLGRGFRLGFSGAHGEAGGEDKSAKEGSSLHNKGQTLQADHGTSRWNLAQPTGWRTRKQSKPQAAGKRASNFSMHEGAVRVQIQEILTIGAGL